MRQVSFAQVLLVLGCFAAIGGAHYLGQYEGTFVSVVVSFLLWMQKPPPGPPPAAVKAAMGVFLGLIIGHLATACTPVTAAEAADIAEETDVLAKCRAEGIAAQPLPDGGKQNIHVYDECLKDAGQ